MTDSLSRRLKLALAVLAGRPPMAASDLDGLKVAARRKAIVVLGERAVRDGGSWDGDVRRHELCDTIRVTAVDIAPAIDAAVCEVVTRMRVESAT